MSGTAPCAWPAEPPGGFCAFKSVVVNVVRAIVASKVAAPMAGEQNLLIGAHVHRTTNPLAEALFLPAVKRAEVALREKVEEVIDLLDLAVHRDAMVAGLPYGARKVVELGRALCTRPKLLLLDEPSSGLNVEETEDMAFWIEDISRDLGITVIMVEHDMTLVSRVSDRVMAMNQGRVLAMGSSSEVQRHPAVVEAYIGTPAGAGETVERAAS